MRGDCDKVVEWTANQATAWRSLSSIISRCILEACVLTHLSTILSLVKYTCRTKDGYRQKNRIAIYHDTGPAYRDTYHDTYHKI